MKIYASSEFLNFLRIASVEVYIFLSTFSIFEVGFHCTVTMLNIEEALSMERFTSPILKRYKIRSSAHRSPSKDPPLASAFQKRKKNVCHCRGMLTCGD